MTFQVFWEASLKAPLLGIWLETEPHSKFAQVVETIERSLSENPTAFGESRQENERVAIFPPLAIIYDVNDSQKTVTILSVRLTDELE